MNMFLLYFVKLQLYIILKDLPITVGADSIGIKSVIATTVKKASWRKQEMKFLSGTAALQSRIKMEAS